MRLKTSRFFFFLFLSFICVLPFAVALDVPKRPDGYVTDKAGMLSAQTRSQLEQLLRQFENQTTNQIVIATFPSLEGGALEDFSIRLAEAWKIGQKGKDNGVIFLIFKEDRKMRIEVGYGLEGVLPDALAGQIISQQVAPLFKQGMYEKGILAGIASIVKATQGEYQAARPRTQRYGYGRSYQRQLTPEEMEALRRQGKVFGTFCLILVVIFFIIDFFRYKQYSREHRIYKSRYSFWEWWFRFAILLFVLSMIFRMLFYAALFSRGGYYGSRGGFGGFSGGGGGSFGGGGASGGW